MGNSTHLQSSTFSGQGWQIQEERGLPPLLSRLVDCWMLTCNGLFLVYLVLFIRRLGHQKLMLWVSSQPEVTQSISIWWPKNKSQWKCQIFELNFVQDHNNPGKIVIQFLWGFFFKWFIQNPMSDLFWKSPEVTSLASVDVNDHNSKGLGSKFYQTKKYISGFVLGPCSMDELGEIITLCHIINIILTRVDVACGCLSASCPGQLAPLVPFL